MADKQGRPKKEPQFKAKSVPVSLTDYWKGELDKECKRRGISRGAWIIEKIMEDRNKPKD